MKSYSVLVLCTPVLGVEWNRTLTAAINDTMFMSGNPNAVNVVSGVTNSHLFFDGLSCNGRILQWTVPKNERGNCPSAAVAPVTTRTKMRGRDSAREEAV